MIHEFKIKISEKHKVGNFFYVITNGHLDVYSNKL